MEEENGAEKGNGAKKRHRGSWFHPDFIIPGLIYFFFGNQEEI